MRHLVAILAFVSALVASGADAATTRPGAYCQAGQAPRFVTFVALKDQLGPAMGLPLECEHASSDAGDVLQQTTTGLAFYDRRSNTPTFTDGGEHWALTEAGLTQWTASWHSGLLPPGPTSAPNDAVDTQALAPPATYPTLEAARLVGGPDGAGTSLVIGRGASLYRIEADAGCLAAAPAEGQPVFVLSSGPFAESGSLLITAVRGRECPILASQELP